MVDVVNPSCFADIVADETPRQRLVRWVMKLSGVSLTNRLPELQGIICRGVDPVSLQSWAWKTNCATSALGFLAAICGSVDEAIDCHPLLGNSHSRETCYIMAWFRKISTTLNGCLGLRMPQEWSTLAEAVGQTMQSPMGSPICTLRGQGRYNTSWTWTSCPFRLLQVTFQQQILTLDRLRLTPVRP